MQEVLFGFTFHTNERAAIMRNRIPLPTDMDGVLIIETVAFAAKQYKIRYYLSAGRHNENYDGYFNLVDAWTESVAKIDSVMVAFPKAVYEKIAMVKMMTFKGKNDPIVPDVGGWIGKHHLIVVLTEGEYDAILKESRTLRYANTGNQGKDKGKENTRRPRSVLFLSRNGRLRKVRSP